MSMPASPTVSVVIPVFNERATIEEIILRVQAVDIEKEILIVDDGSTDGTREFLAALVAQPTPVPGASALSRTQGALRADNIRVFLQKTNCGKGAALRRGFEEARGQIVIIQDADLEYDPQDYHKLIEPIVRGAADVVYGSRFLGGPHRVLFFWHYVRNKFLTTVSDMFTNLNLSDVWTCYKAFRREVLGQINLQENRFGFEQEIPPRLPGMAGACTRSRLPITDALTQQERKSPGKMELEACGASCVTARGPNGPLTAETQGRKGSRRLHRKKSVLESVKSALSVGTSVSPYLCGEGFPKSKIRNLKCLTWFEIPYGV